MDHIGAAVHDVGALDEIGELALGQARPQVIAQGRHAAIGQRRADPHPIDFLRRLDLPQLHIAPVEVGDGAEPRREHGVLLESHGPDHADAAGARSAALKRGNGGGNR